MNSAELLLKLSRNNLMVKLKEIIWTGSECQNESANMDQKDPNESAKNALPGVNFIKALTPAFFYWRENANKIVMALKRHFFGQQILSNMLPI